MKFTRNNIPKWKEKFGNDFNFSIPRSINGKMIGKVVYKGKEIKLEEDKEYSFD